MPRLPIDYSKTVIYKIVCNNLNIKDLYVGSTTDFRRRKSEHKRCCEANKNFKVYVMINANGGWDNWTMIEIEKYTDCIDGNQSRTRERHYYELLNANMNSYRPKVTIEEVKDKFNEYKQLNKDKLKEYIQEYRQLNKDKFKEYNQSNKDKIKEYQQLNKEAINKRRRELRALKKENKIVNP